MSSETVRNIGFQSGIDAVLALAPQSIADATPVLSSAIDTTAYPRKRIMVVFANKEATATTHTMAVTVTESATSGGSYTAATTSGTATAISADGVQYISVKRNPAMPFIKTTLTGSHADVDTLSSVVVLFIPDRL
jgi:hypothetical protein